MKNEDFQPTHVSAETLLAAIVESSDDAIISKDLSGTIMSWNKAAERIFGYQAAEVVGGPISVIIPPERGAEEPEILARIGRGERIDHFETVRMRKDGTRIDISVTISPLMHNGKIVGASKVARDITVQKKIEREIEQARARLEVTLSSIGDAVIVTDVNANVTFMNPVASALTGWKLEDAVGQPLELVFSIVNEATRRRPESPAAKALREGMVVGLANHTILLSKSGLEYAIDDSAAPIRDPRGDIFGVVLVFRDVSGARAAEEHRERLAAIVHSSDDAIIGKDLAGRITSWNAAAERLYGYTAEEAIGRPISMLIPPDRLGEESDILARIRRGERVDHIETVRITKDRRKVFVSLTISPIRDMEGNVIGASKIARDITDRKRTERELFEAREKLQNYSAELEKTVTERTAELRQALEQLEAFSYSISHDLRAPLRAMNGFVDVVLKEHAQGLSQEGRELLVRVGNAGRRLGELIEEVLSSAHVSGMSRPVVLSTLVPRVIEDYPNLREHRHQIEVKQPLLDVSGTEPLLTQCLANLLNNAIKFMPNGREPRIEVWTEPVGERVRLHVKDNGMGIPEHEQPRLFEMFMRGGASRHIEGSGVGLAIVKRAVDRMRGAVGVTSKPGEGSDFWIELAAAKA